MRAFQRSVMGVFALSGLFAVASPVLGQTAPPVAERRGDVSIGIATVHDSGFAVSSPHVTATWRPWKSAGIVVDVLTRGRLESDILGGIRFQGDRPVSPYVQILVSPLLAFQAGVGTDLRIMRRFNARVGADYWFTEEDGSPLRRTRLSIGVAYVIR